jgi:phosphoesterase RecJ-like protein
MTYETGVARCEAIDAVLTALRGKETAILTTHINADGDGCGSEIALAAWLRELGTEAFIVNPTPVPASFLFLVPDESWVVDSTSAEAQELCDGADVAVVLDTGEVPRIGRVRPLIDGLPTVVIDHHPPGDRPIEGVSLRDSSASATGELIFDIIHRAGGPWPAFADLAMYVAIMTDTGSFRFSNTTPTTLRIAAELVGRGVSPDETYRRIYASVPRRQYHLLESSLALLEVDEEAGVAWMTVPADRFEALGAIPDDLEGLVDYPRAVAGVEVGLLFRQIPRKGIKVSFRSNGAVDVNALARQFGGGGHVRAAGALIEGRLDQVRQDVTHATRQAVELSRSGR